MIRLWQTDIKAAPASERPDCCVTSCRLCPGVLHLNTPWRLQLMANELKTLCVWVTRYPSAPLGGGSLYLSFKKGNWKTHDYVCTSCCNEKAILKDVIDKTPADGTCFSSHALICFARQPIRVIYSMAMPLIQNAVSSKKPVDKILHLEEPRNLLAVLPRIRGEKDVLMSVHWYGAAASSRLA